jgi:hypothetical protein
MTFLTFRIPANVYLREPYQLTETILLQPAQRVQLEFVNQPSFLCSFFYVEFNPPADTDFPPEWPYVPSYENLKNFITFWSFIQSDHSAICAFERGDGPSLGEIPHENSSHWNNGIETIDPNSIRIRSGNDFSPGTFELRDVYRRFIEADEALRDLIALKIFTPNRHVKEPRRQAYDNHLMRSAFDWIIVDALSPAVRCEASIECVKCGKQATSSHVAQTFLERMELTLLKDFPDAKKYAKILNAYKNRRADFFHWGRREDIPPIEYPTRDAVTGKGLRSVSLDETIEMFRKEGFATKSASHLLNDIVHCVLLNRLIPELALWPRFEPLKLFSFG